MQFTRSLQHKCGVCGPQGAIQTCRPRRQRKEQESQSARPCPRGRHSSVVRGLKAKANSLRGAFLFVCARGLTSKMIVSTGHFCGVLREHAYVLRHVFPSPVCPCRLACVPHVVCSCRMLKVHVRAQELSEGRLRLVVRGGACASSCRQHESCRRPSKVDLLPNDRRQTCRRI